jgi:hypothetical protein
MAASVFGGGEAFRLSAAPGAGVLKLHKGDITLWSVDGATDAIVRSSPPPTILTCPALPRLLLVPRSIVCVCG